MSKDEINKLRGLVYEYCLEWKVQYVGGQTMKHTELNKMNFEKLSGFVNWIEFEKLDKPTLAKPKQDVK